MATETVDIKLNPDDLTLGDLEDFEELVGKPIDEVVKPVPVTDEFGARVFDAKGRPEMTVKVPTKAVIALVWLSQRRDNPEFTLADARKVRVGSLVMTETNEADQKKDAAA